MKEFDIRSGLVYVNGLDTEKFAGMLKDPSQCYKFYWLEAILKLTWEEERELTFDEIIDEMIWAVWHSVTEYHLHLGPAIRGKSENFLERIVKTLEQDPDLPRPVTREGVLAAIRRNEESIKKDKNNLAACVPYRLLSSFLEEINGSDRLWGSRGRFITYVQQVSEETDIFYTIVDGRGLQKRVRMNPHWRQLVLDNYQVISGWIRMKKAQFLQDRNPGVPGIIYKLEANTEGGRKLGHARALWKAAAEASRCPIRDIYTGDTLKETAFELDHFIPWSYIANNELWNLTPMDGRLNASKGNRLPEWNRYFPPLAEHQYVLYKSIFTYSEVRERFEKCRRDNLNAIWAAEELFVEGNTRERFGQILERNFRPVYEMARLQGYGLWRGAESLAERGGASV